MSSSELPVGVHLYWIPLGAGGSGFVRLNGRLYEWFKAGWDRRQPLDLYHTALQVQLPDHRFVIETMWPSPDQDTSSRGVVVEGPVGASVFSRWRVFRYEVRRWREGILPDADQAPGGPVLVTAREDLARLVLALVEEVPVLIWGRDQSRVGEMWNSNSVISWLLARAHLLDGVKPPRGGRAPGWDAGKEVARQRPAQDRREGAGLDVGVSELGQRLVDHVGDQSH